MLGCCWLSTPRLYFLDCLVEMAELRRCAGSDEVLEVVEHGLELRIGSHGDGVGSDCLGMLKGVEQRYVRMRFE